MNLNRNDLDLDSFSPSEAGSPFYFPVTVSSTNLPIHEAIKTLFNALEQLIKPSSTSQAAPFPLKRSTSDNNSRRFSNSTDSSTKDSQDTVLSAPLALRSDGSKKRRRPSDSFNEPKLRRLNDAISKFDKLRFETEESMDFKELPPRSRSENDVQDEPRRNIRTTSWSEFTFTSHQASTPQLAAQEPLPEHVLAEINRQAKCKGYRADEYVMKWQLKRKELEHNLLFLQNGASDKYSDSSSSTFDDFVTITRKILECAEWLGDLKTLGEMIPLWKLMQSNINNVIKYTQQVEARCGI